MTGGSAGVGRAVAEALARVARTLRAELAAEGIEVLLATLGPVESEFWTALVRGERPAWSQGRGMPPEQAAAAILAGLRRRQGEIVPGWQAKGYVFLARYFPGLIDRWAARNWRRGGADARRQDARGGAG